MFRKLRKFNDDYFGGKQSENRVLPIIKQFFNDESIKQTEDRMCKYDFISENLSTKYELKTRNNKLKAYNTTMIGQDKMCDNLVLLFQFTDGLYYIKYDKELIETFSRCLFKRDNRIDYNDVEKQYVYIPIEHLKEVMTTITL